MAVLTMHDIVVGQEYEWLMPHNPATKKLFRYLRPTIVTVVAKSGARVRVRFTFDDKEYERSISTVNMLTIKEPA